MDYVAMKVYLKYILKDNNEDVLKKAADWMSENGMETDIYPDYVYAEKSFDYEGDGAIEDRFLGIASNDSKNLYKILGTDFLLTGVIDTSDFAGECKDFSLCCKGGIITAKASDWYIETSMDSYEDYEDFHEDFEEITKEEYAQICDCDFIYEIEEKDGVRIAGEVPQYDIVITGR